MSLWRQVKYGLRSLVDRSAADADIEEEVGHWLDAATAALVAEGVDPAEARRRVTLEYGRAAGVREEVRSYGWENLVMAVGADVRLAARRLRGDPVFTVVAALTLAMGLGATTAIFSAVRPVLLDPLPYPGGEALMAVSDRGLDGGPLDVTFGTFREIVARSESFRDLAVMRPWQPTLTGAGEPERLTGQRVSAAYFDVLRVFPALGRSFDAAMDEPGAGRVVVLADGLWRGRFGADSAIVGRTIRLDGDPYTVLGVMPRDFENVVASAARIWTPLQYDATLPSFEGREWGHHLEMIGRHRTGTDLAAVREDLARIAANPVVEAPRPPWASLEGGLLVGPLGDAVTRAARPVLLAITGAVVLLLLIACVNVTNLQLARGARRHGEFALRIALGAGRGRLIRQVLVESLLLAALGGAVGVGLAAVGVRALVGLAPPGLPRIDAISLDAQALAVAFLVTVLAGAGIGLAAAFGGRRTDRRGGSVPDLAESTGRSTARHRYARSALVVAEVALTLVLLVGAGLLVRSLDRLLAVDPGFHAANVIGLEVRASGLEDDAIHRFYDRALEAVRAVPGIEMAALTSQLPLTGESSEYGVHPAAAASGSVGGTDAEGATDLGAQRYAVSPGYFEAMGIPRFQGRLLDAGDRAGAPGAVVVSRSFARRAFPGRDPIGERLHVGRTDLPWYTVVGVVGDVRQLSLESDATQAVYMTPAQWYFADAGRWLVVRTGLEPGAIVPRLRSAIRTAHPDQPVTRITTLPELVLDSAAERRFAQVIFQVFAGAALLLAALGIYGVLAGGVAERRRELGVRSALGASRARLVRLVLGQGLILTGLGLVAGAPGAAALSRALETLLFDISPMDPITYLSVAAVLIAVAGASCALPAWRAARVHPATALRTD